MATRKPSYGTEVRTCASCGKPWVNRWRRRRQLHCSASCGRRSPKATAQRQRVHAKASKAGGATMRRKAALRWAADVKTMTTGQAAATFYRRGYHNGQLTGERRGYLKGRAEGFEQGLRQGRYEAAMRKSA